MNHCSDGQCHRIHVQSFNETTDAFARNHPVLVRVNVGRDDLRDWFMWRNFSITMFCAFFFVFVALDCYYFYGIELPVLTHRVWNINDGMCLSRNCTHQSPVIQRKSTKSNRNRADGGVSGRMNEPTELCDHTTNVQNLRDYAMASMNIEAIPVIYGTNVYAEQFLSSKPLSQRKSMEWTGQNFSFKLPFGKKAVLDIKLIDVHVLPEYVDVLYEHSDNGIALDTSRRSNVQHWRAPMQELLNTKCRHPLPKQYFLTMHPYSDRHTTASPKICTRTSGPASVQTSETPFCPSGLPHNSLYFQRSINGQCTQNKASFLPPQRNSFYCTSNTPLVNKVFEEHISERQSYLKDAQCDAQRRLCQTCIRRSCGTGHLLPFMMHSSSLLGLDHYDLETNTHGRPEANTSHQMGDQHCCGIECYSSPSCLDYFAPTCQAHTINHPQTQEVCLQGKTLKFTLNPEFEFTNGSYMCHLQYRSPKRLYSVKLEILLNATWLLEGPEYAVHLAYLGEQPWNPKVGAINKLFTRDSTNETKLLIERQKYGNFRLWNHNIQIVHRSSADIWEQAILKQSSSSEHLSLYRLRTFDEFIRLPPEIHKHKEEKYITVQFTKPFFYNTEDWMNQSCHLNIKHVHRSQPIYDETSGIPVTLSSPVVKQSDGAFKYSFATKKQPANFEVIFDPDNSSSLLRYAMCDLNLPMKYVNPKGRSHGSPQLFSTGYIVNQLGMELKITRRLVNIRPGKGQCQTEETWTLDIEGWITEKPIYMHIGLSKQIVLVSSNTHDVHKRKQLERILDQDVLLLPNLSEIRNRPVSEGKTRQSQFLLSFDVVRTTHADHTTTHISLLHIEVEDCLHRYRLQTILDKPRHFQIERNRLVRPNPGNPAIPLNSSSSHAMWKIGQMYWPFVLVCTTSGASYLLLLLIYGILRACTNVTRHTRLSHSARQVSHHLSTPFVSASSSTNLLSSAVSGKHTLSPLTPARKMLILTYMCFRIFYTFLFTISVGLSLVLSMESSAARDIATIVHGQSGEYMPGRSQTVDQRDYTSHVVNPVDISARWSGARQWIFEAARMEDFSNSELLRQMQAMTNQITDCSEENGEISKQIMHTIHMAGRKFKEWLDPKNGKINLLINTQPPNVRNKDFDNDENNLFANATWTTEPTETEFLSITQSAWKFIQGSCWTPFLDQVDNHLRQLRDDLDTKVIDHWTAFDRILLNVLSSTWIAPARRTLNQTWFRLTPTAEMSKYDANQMQYEGRHQDSHSHDSMTNENRRAREARGLKLSSFIGVPQPQHARLTGARIWNSFRSLVPGLPSHLYHEINPGHKDSRDKQDRNIALTNLIEQRYMISNEDWKHVAGGFLGTSQNVAYHRHPQSALIRFHTTIKSGSIKVPSESRKYYLTMTQVRLLLLLLDAIIILARCYQTYRFMQRAWFGGTERVFVASMDPYTVSTSSVNTTEIPMDYSTSMGQTSFLSDHIGLPKYSQTSDCCRPANSPSSLKEPTKRIINLDGYASDGRNLSVASESQYVAFGFGHAERLRSPVLTLRAGEIHQVVDGSNGRLTASYCCLDAHYLLLILGIGLMIIGIFLLWVTDRHARPGWLWNKTSLYTSSKALEECRLRSNAVLKNLHPYYWTTDVMRTARRNALKDSRRMEQWTNRIKHEKLQLYSQYLNELCAIEQSHLVSRPSRTSATSKVSLQPIVAAVHSSQSPCVLFGKESQFNMQTKRSLMRYLDSSSTRSVVVAVKPLCLFSPLIPATYAQGQLPRLRFSDDLDRNTSSLSDSFDKTSGVTNYNGWTVPMESMNGLLLSCHRLIVTGLIVVLAMGGMLVCLHVVKLLFLHCNPQRVGKLKILTTNPVPPRQINTFSAVRQASSISGIYGTPL